MVGGGGGGYIDFLNLFLFVWGGGGDLVVYMQTNCYHFYE